ncbi:MAG: flagellar biosynthetic protein FliR [Phycisphaerales bacterium]
MTTLAPIIESMAPLTLVLARMGGMVGSMPLVSGIAVPIRVRAMLALALSVVVFAASPARASHMPDLDLLAYLPVMLGETLLGVCIGMIGGLPLAMLQLAGHLLGYQMGLSIAQTFNPAMDNQGDVASQILFFLGITLYISLGGLDALLLTLLQSYDHVPIGAFAVSHAPLGLFVDVLQSGFEVAISVAAPVMGVVTLLMVAMGFIMKTMPQINVLSVGFAIKMLAGLLMLTLTIYVVADVASEHIVEVVGRVGEWAGGLGAPTSGGTW